MSPSYLACCRDFVASSVLTLARNLVYLSCAGNVQSCNEWVSLSHHVFFLALVVFQQKG